MAEISLFDVIGPNMVGPSSSHTAGAVSMALLAGRIFQGTEKRKRTVKRVDFILYGSFAETYKGHGTDRALLGGILGFEPDDLRIRDAFFYAEKAGLEYAFSLSEDHDMHPNTADITIEGTDGRKLFVRGVSTGGGKIKLTLLNQIRVEIEGGYSTLIISHADRQGVAAHITKCLNDCGINIAFMRIFREEKGTEAYTVVESDEEIGAEVISLIGENSNILDVIFIADGI